MLLGEDTKRLADKWTVKILSSLQERPIATGSCDIGSEALAANAYANASQSRILRIDRETLTTSKFIAVEYSLTKRGKDIYRPVDKHLPLGEIKDLR